NRVEVVDRVIQDFETRRVFEKRPQLPRLLDDDPDFDVDDVAEDAAGDEIAERNHVGTESQLEVESGGKIAFPADGENLPGGGEIFAHRLLHKHTRSVWESREHAQNLIARYGHVEHRSLEPCSLIERREHMGHSEFLSRTARGIRVDIENARNGQVKPAVG